MALISCPECGGSTSDSANTCPHCGYPINQYISKQQYKSEVERLLGKIKKIEFTCPEPRAKVCIKCSRPLLNDGTKLCKCGINGTPFPDIEVDYPRVGWGGQLGSERFIHTDCVIPRDIGDPESKEYIQYEESLNSYIKKYEDDCKSGKRQPHWIFEPTPPKTEWFGEQPLSEEELKEIHEFFSRPSPSPVPSPSLPRCPFCSSTNLSKITVVKKATKTWLFGLLGALDDAGKTYKCNNCGSKF